MRVTLDEIEAVINALGTAMTHAREARRVAKKVYGDDREISIHLKYAYEEIQQAVKLAGDARGGAMRHDGMDLISYMLVLLAVALFAIAFQDQIAAGAMTQMPRLTVETH